MFPFQNKEKKRAIEKICYLFTAIWTNWRSVGVCRYIHLWKEGRVPCRTYILKNNAAFNIIFALCYLLYSFEVKHKSHVASLKPQFTHLWRPDYTVEHAEFEL